MKFKFTINSKDLTKAFSTVGKVINRRSAMPILNNVMLAYNEELGFQLTASNAESWIRLTLGKDQETEQDIMALVEGPKQPEAVCIPYMILSSALATLPSVMLVVNIDTDTMKMEVNYLTGQFSVPIVSADEFPAMPPITDTTCAFKAQTDWLLPRLRAARACIEPDDLRPVLSGAAIDVSQEGYTIVGTNGHSIFKDVFQHGVPFLDSGQPETILIPEGNLDAIQTAFAVEEEIAFNSNGRMLYLKTEKTEMVMRTIEGKYPNYNSVIPKDQPHHILIEKSSFMAAIRRVRIFADDSSDMLRVSRNGDNLTLMAEDFQYNQSGQENVPIINVESCSLPDGFTIAFKIATLMPLMACIKTENAILNLSDNEHAVTIREEDNNSALLLLIMPMRIVTD